MKDYYIVYTQDGCSYCDKAIGTLRQHKQPFMVGNLTHNPELLEEVKKQKVAAKKKVTTTKKKIQKTKQAKKQAVPKPKVVKS